MGGLVPTAHIDVMPGDNFKISVENFLRLAPLVAPVMHDLRVKTYWFFVPNRLLWDKFEEFISNDETHIINEGGSALVLPYLFNDNGIGGAAWSVGSMHDFLGIPPEVPPNMRVSAFPIAAMSLIWDEWFRDQDLQDKKFTPLVEGDNTAAYSVQLAGQTPHHGFPVGWEHDYFTAGRPWPQKGDAITLPVVSMDELPVVPATNPTTPIIRETATGNPVVPQPPDTEEWLFTTVGGFLDAGQNSTQAQAAYIDPNDGLVVQLNNAAVPITDIRRAFKLSEFLELDSATGSRYTEILRGHFDVISPDARLQRPEFVGSVSARMVISEVLQTTSAVVEGAVGTGSPLGTMGGHGISVGGGKGFNYRATEHGQLIGLISVMPKAAYQQGLPRKFSRLNRYDYPWPKLAHIGHQEVLNKEIYVEHPNPDDAFSYLPQYSEMRYEPNRVAGSMRTTLAHWHMGRIFDGAPGLNAQFIQGDPTSRIFAVQYEGGGEPAYAADQIFGHIFNNVSVLRKLPKYGRPML